MCDTTFAFGQRGSHLFQCPSHIEHTRLPRKLSNLLNSPKLKQVHHVTLGFGDSFLLTWRDTTNQDHIDSADLPAELITFLYARNQQRGLVRDIPNIRCTLGPYNASFFAYDKAGYLWMNMPAKLLSALTSRIKDGTWLDKPRIVALGADDDFLLLTEKHAAVWDLENYRTISKLLDFSRTQTHGIAEIHSIVLHPYRFQSYVTQSRNGTLLFDNLPPHSLLAMQALVPAVLQDTQKAGAWPLFRAESAKKEAPPPRRQSNLQQRAQLRKDWGERRHEVSTQGKGIKLSLSVSLSVGGLTRMLG